MPTYSDLCLELYSSEWHRPRRRPPATSTPNPTTTSSTSSPERPKLTVNTNFPSPSIKSKLSLFPDARPPKCWCCKDSQPFSCEECAWKPRRCPFCKLHPRLCAYRSWEEASAAGRTCVKCVYVLPKAAAARAPKEAPGACWLPT